MRLLVAAALALLGSPVAAETPDEVARRHGLAGEVLIAKGGKVLLDQGYGTIAPGGGAKHKAGERWRLASITKQVTAALRLQQAARLLVSIDRPYVNMSDDPEGSFINYGPFGRARGLTIRQLMTHHTGLANPDDTPKNSSGVPTFYTASYPNWTSCLSKLAEPGAPFAYNNCDYILLGRQIRAGWPNGMVMARKNEVGVPGFVGGKPEPKFQLSSWGAAGGLMGTARAVFDFDRSLMTGKLLPPAALAELWRPEGNGSYQALGQWVFPGKLKGCAVPKRIVQRDGEIYGVQARNFILPDDDLVVIVFTNRSSDDFAMGEVWESKGFAYDLLSAAVAC